MLTSLFMVRSSPALEWVPLLSTNPTLREVAELPPDQREALWHHLMAVEGEYRAALYLQQLRMLQLSLIARALAPAMTVAQVAAAAAVGAGPALAAVAAPDPPAPGRAPAARRQAERQPGLNSFRIVPGQLSRAPVCDVGAMDQGCYFCGALMFKGEAVQPPTSEWRRFCRATGRHLFSQCCQKGAVAL